VLRYNTDGSLDTTFNSTGYVITHTTSPSSGQAVAVLSSGDILVVGSAGGAGLQWLWYTPSGQLDPNFGSGTGVVSLLAPGAIDGSNNALVIDTNGNIITAGYSDPSNYYSYLTLVRLNSTGVQDTTFGTNGFVTLPSFIGTGIAIATNGVYMVGGWTTPKSYTNAGLAFAIAAFLPTGAPDTTFGTNGETTTSFSGSSNTRALALAEQSDGNIVLAGYTYNGSYSYALAGYLGFGALPALPAPLASSFTASSSAAVTPAAQPSQPTSRPELQSTCSSALVNTVRQKTTPGLARMLLRTVRSQLIDLAFEDPSWLIRLA
jgi:uncharacterized delta-60 repeat protein